jgi:MGT family glycosyltransferase
MANVLWLSWCGGGNLPPSLGIARALAELGHTVSFAGRSEMLDRVRAAGFRAIEFTDSYKQLDAYPADSPVRKMICYLTAPSVADQAEEIVKQEAPDLVLIDAKFIAAQSTVLRLNIPSAVICHTFFYRMLETWQDHFRQLDKLRQEAGFSPLQDLDRLWLGADKILVTTLAEFDRPPNDSAYSDLVVHVGPVLDMESHAAPAPLPWAIEDPTPVILLSLSTQPEQRALEVFQKTLDALGLLPVYVIATTAGIIRPEELNVPSNAVVLQYVDHESVMKRASLVITHGGHGTAMRALRHGVPLVFMPGIAPDQPIVAAACAELGVGRVIPADADVNKLRSLVVDSLNTTDYFARASGLAGLLQGNNAAKAAASELQRMLV